MVRSESFLKNFAIQIDKVASLSIELFDFSGRKLFDFSGIATGLAIVFPLSAVIPYAYCGFF